MKARREWGERDPIRLCKEMLLEKKIITKTEFLEISGELDCIVADSLARAQKLPYPDINDMRTRVFASASQ